MEWFELLLGTGGITTAMIFIGKTIINKSFDAALENYKSGLKKIEFEHQIRYSRLHEQRADAVKEIYNHVLSFEDALNNSTTFHQGPEWLNDSKREKLCDSALNEMMTAVEVNRIYFSDELYDKLINLKNKGHEAISDMSSARILASSSNVNIYKQGREKWDNARKKVIEEIPTVKKELIDLFRNILGVSQ